MFSGHFPVGVSLSWFWKCVLVAEKYEGGAQADWFDVITKAQSEEPLLCDNIMREAAFDVTLLRHLQVQSDIYYSNGDRANAADVYDEIIEIMSNTVNYWDVTSFPTLVCRCWTMSKS